MATSEPDLSGTRGSGSSPSATAATALIVRLFDRHKTTVWRYLRYLGCNAAEADDLTQETFLKVFRSQDRFDDRGDAAARKYLTLTARHLFISHIRSRRELASLDQIEDADATWQRTYDAAGTEDPRLDALRTCINALAGVAAKAVSLFYEEQRTGPEISQELGLSEEYVRVLLTRTRKALRDCVQRKTTGKLSDES